jgi:hypothetical protein
MRAHQVRSYGPNVTADDHPIQHYEIRVKGVLGSRWAAWFEGLSVTNEADGTTAIHGPVIDQAALHGLLLKLRDLGIPLISLTQIPPDVHTQPNERH